MNPNRKKKLFAALLAGVLSFSAMTGMFDRVSVSAAEEKPFISDTDGNGRINIDESQIQVDITKGGVNGTSLNAAVVVKSVKSNGAIQVPLLSNVSLTMEISADGLTEDMVSHMELTVTAKNNGSDPNHSFTEMYSKKTYSYSAPTSAQPFGTYTVTFHFTAYGTDLAFYTNSFDVADLQFHGGAVVTSLSGLYVINVDTPLEDVVMRVPVKSDISTAEYKKWATRVAVYANSLSELTNYRNSRLMIVMDDESLDPTKYAGVHKGNGILGYSTDTTNIITAYIANDENIIERVEMHEISHAHRFGTNFKNSFQHYTSYGTSADEVYTNVRGITAIQNCDNLQDTKIIFGVQPLSYDSVMINQMEFKDGAELRVLAAYMVNIAYEKGWEFLEEFFKAETAYLYEDYPAVIDEFKTYIGKEFKADATAYKKHAMAMYALYDLAKKNNNISAKGNFTDFMDRYFYDPKTGKNCIKCYVDRHLKDDLYPIQITQQPTNVSALSGTTVKTSVTASGDGLQYQWYYCNAGSTAFMESNNKTKNYTATMTDAADGRQVYCVITDENNNTLKTKTVTLTMDSPIMITKHPTNASAPNGMTVKTSVTATGDGLKYQWYYCNAGSTAFMESSNQTETYAATMENAADGRQVYCVITDANNNRRQTNPVTLTKAYPVKIARQPTNVSALDGSTIKTYVTARGDGLKYQWYYCNANDTEFQASVNTTATYSTTMGISANGRKIYCVITDQYGKSAQSDTVTLTMAYPVTITKQPTNASAPSGTVVKTSVTAVGDGLKYQWYYCNAGGTTFKKSSVQTATYSTTMDETVDGWKVYCVITDRYGKRVQSDTVTLTMEQGEETTTTEPLTPSLMGDVNCDGLVKIDDVVLLNRYIGEDTTITITAQGIANGDCDHSGLINAEDSGMILRYLAGLGALRASAASFSSYMASVLRAIL